ncbi:hypothetical protein OROHE_001330 [Orobanche hederae]
MGWFVRERRGISWKDQTLDSSSAPPLPLMVFFGLFITLMISAAYSDFRQRVEANKMKLRFGLLLLPLAGILVADVMLLGSLRRRWWRFATGVLRWPGYEAVADEGSSPWGLRLVLLLVLLIVMVYYQPSFQSVWFRSV